LHPIFPYFDYLFGRCEYYLVKLLQEFDRAIDLLKGVKAAEGEA